MAETHDTIDGLLAEFRGYAFGMPPSYHVTMSWADFRMMLDRFDAAHKREVREAVTCSNQLREAAVTVYNVLEKLRPFSLKLGDVGSKREFGHLVCLARNRLDAALSSPPRNCDVGMDNEQIRRWKDFCYHYEVDRSPESFARWAQGPYFEEGGAE